MLKNMLTELVLKNYSHPKAKNVMLNRNNK